MKVHLYLLILSSIVTFVLGVFVTLRFTQFLDEDEIFDGKAKDPVKESKKYKETE